MCPVPGAHGASRGSMELGGNPLLSEMSTEDNYWPQHGVKPLFGFSSGSSSLH